MRNEWRMTLGLMLLTAAAVLPAPARAEDGRFGVRFDPEGPRNASTDAGLNLFGGVGLRAGSVIPYVQLKVIVMEASELSVAFGLRF